MNAALLRELLDKYMAETATEQECMRLHQLLLDPAYSNELATIITDDLETGHYNNEEDPVIKSGLQARILNDIRRENETHTVAMRATGKRKSWLRYAAAAAFIIIAAASWLLYYKGKRSDIRHPQISKSDFPPGHNGAMLTLANGSIILLDSAANGTIAVESNTTITHQNGLLSYNITSDISKSDISKSYNTITTPHGRQFSLLLPDGSRVWLNAASSLRYPVAFSGNDRTVELNGEAYFEIAANARQPFFVQSAGQRVQVLGTSFNINAYTNEPHTKTTLLDGSIRLSTVSGGQSFVVLTPGQQARLNGQALTVQPADVQQAVAWKNGLFSFRQADLKTIMRQLERWYTIEVKFEGDAGNETFTGKIGRNLSLRDVMDGLASTHVKYRIEGNRVIVLP